MKIKILIILILIYPLIFLFQGGDLTDVGFCCTNYYYFKDFLFDGPGHDATLVLFLTNMIGSLWLYFFPFLGVFGLKLLYLLFLYGSIFISYKVLTFFSEKKNLILFGLFFGEVFMTRYTPFVFSYDICSWFFLNCSILLFMYSFKSKNWSFSFLCGVSIALAILSRITSIAAIPMGLLLFFSPNKNGLSQRLLLFWYFSAGLILTLSIFIVFISLVSGGESLTLMLKNLVTPKTTERIYVYFEELLFFLKFFCAIFLILASSLILKKLGLLKNIILFCLLFFTVLIFYGYFNFNFDKTQSLFSYDNNIKIILPAFLTFPIIVGFYNYSELRLLILSIIICSFAQVFGTNTGLFLKLCFGCLLLIPLSLVILGDFSMKKYSENLFDFMHVFKYAYFLLFFLSFVNRFCWIYHVESGIGARIKCLEKINNFKMFGVLTNYRNAKIIDFSSNINNLKNEKLLVFGHEPMLYYLTEKKPVIDPFWLKNNVVSLNTFDKKINLLKDLPIILDTKERVYGLKGEVCLKDFLSKKKYFLFSNSPYGAIWIPSSN